MTRTFTVKNTLIHCEIGAFTVANQVITVGNRKNFAAFSRPTYNSGANEPGIGPTGCGTILFEWEANIPNISWFQFTALSRLFTMWPQSTALQGTYGPFRITAYATKGKTYGETHSNTFTITV